MKIHFKLKKKYKKRIYNGVLSAVNKGNVIIYLVF